MVYDGMHGLRPKIMALGFLEGYWPVLSIRIGKRLNGFGRPLESVGTVGTVGL